MVSNINLLQSLRERESGKIKKKMEGENEWTLSRGGQNGAWFLPQKSNDASDKKCHINGKTSEHKMYEIYYVLTWLAWLLFDIRQCPWSFEWPTVCMYVCNAFNTERNITWITSVSHVDSSIRTNQMCPHRIAISSAASEVAHVQLSQTHRIRVHANTNKCHNLGSTMPNGKVEPSWFMKILLSAEGMHVNRQWNIVQSYLCAKTVAALFLSLSLPHKHSIFYVHFGLNKKKSETIYNIKKYDCFSHMRAIRIRIANNTYISQPLADTIRRVSTFIPAHSWAKIILQPKKKSQ